MLVNIIKTFDDNNGLRRYPGENPDVDPAVARQWIADGYASADTDGDAGRELVTLPLSAAAIAALQSRNSGLVARGAAQLVASSTIEGFDVAMASPPTVTTSATQTISGGTYFRWDSSQVSVNGLVIMSGAPPYGEFKRVDNGYPDWAGGANVRDVGGPCASWIETDSQNVEVNILEFQTGQILFIVDDEFVSLTPTATADTFANRFIKLAFSDRKLRKIRIEFAGCLLGGFVIDSNAAALVRPESPRIHIVGDSFVQIALGGNLTSTSKALANQLSRRLRYDNVWPNGAGERGYLQGVTAGNAPNLLGRIDTDLLPILQDGDLVINLNGFNDRAFSATQMGDAVAQFVSAIRQHNSKVDVAIGTPFRPRPAAGGAFTEPVGHTAAIASAAVATGACMFNMNDLFTGNGSNGTGTGNSALHIGPDDLHPNDGGYVYSVTALVRKLRSALIGR